MRTIRWLPGLLPLCALSLGCTAAGMREPTVDFRSMRVEHIGLDGFTMRFAVEIDNPNPVPIPLRHVEYGLRIGDAQLLEGRARPAEAIPAGDSLQIELPVTITWANVLAAEEAIRRSRGDVDYLLEGRLEFEPPEQMQPPVRVPLAYGGQISIRRLVRDVIDDPRAVLRSPALRRLAQIILREVLD